ncbi:Ig-like domain-containing protein [Pseudomonas sp. ANT_J28]|uniref:Ig-like domain-containing protein n=1 Tax=Pseudomonas sp. ANT_J28 TaxID=2597352 RepID=UPI002114997B|nr:Ig-like domain-containing protein [Pseudomonas sp. ANT_J28]
MSSFSRFLFIPRESLSLFMSPLQLWPLFIAGMVRPVEDADGGINIAVVEDHPNGVLSVIDPYLNMAINDELKIFWNDKLVRELKVKPEDLKKRLFFFLPANDIVPGLAECYYQLTRAGETVPDDPSAKLSLLVKLDKPAGGDNEPHKPWHSELAMVQLPQDVIDNGVTKEWAAKGVPMTIRAYPGIALRDVIQVQWGSVFLLPHELSQAEVDGTAAIVISAQPADILSAGDADKVRIHYEVHDELWNYSERWSKDTTVLVEAGAARLDAAIFKEADNGQIHLKDLDHQPVTLQILIKSDDVFDLDDTIKIRVIGTPLPGSPSRTFPKEVPVGQPPYILETPIPFEFVSLFALGTLDASYELHKKDGSEPLSSKRAFVDVIGDPAQLPAPTIDEVIGAVLPADAMMATVVIRYPTIANGDLINLIWEGLKSDGTPYVHEEQHAVSDNEQKEGSVIIYVWGEHIQALNNGSLKLYYRVSNDDTDKYGVSNSDFLRVEVGSLRATLPAPDVEEAKDGVIDPSQVYTQAHVLIKPVNWAKGDTLTYHWIGINPFGTTRGSVPITTTTIGKTVRFRVDAKYVTANIGYNVTARYTLLHAATGKYSYSAPLEVMVGIPLGLLPPPKVVQAPSGTLNPMDALNGVDIECSYASMDKTLDLLGLKWRGTPGDGTSEDLEKPAEASGTVTFHLPAKVVGANIRREVSVSYAVQRYNLWTPSEELSLNILGFQDPDKDLPTPEVPLALAGVLDLMEFTGDARVLVKPWPFIAARQRVWLSVEGRTSTGVYIIDLLKGHSLSDPQATQGLNETLLRTDLLKLVHSSAATVKCKVIFDGSEDEATAIDFPSLPLTIRTRYDYVKPVITSVKNSQNDVIPEAGLTYDKRVTIHGTATRGEKVDVQINGVSKGMPLVADSSTWELPVELVEGLQRIIAIAQYDADEKDSEPRTFTIGIATEPKIIALTDSKGSVGHNGTTYDTEVTVTVKADTNQRVQLYDSSTPIGAPILLDGKGEGTTKLSNLIPKIYSIKARALYGDGLESPAHVFTAKLHLAVTLTSVRHSGGELNNGGRTTDTSVSLTGAVTPLYEVQLYDNNGPKHTVPGGPTGVWTTTLAIALGEHSVYAKALATGQNSNTRSFTRDAPLPPLNFNTSPVTLRGKTYIMPGYPTILPAFGAGNSVQHQASGGRPGYTYTSSNPGVAAVNGAGLVTVRGRGATTITARDAAGQSKSYTVTVTGVIHCIGLGNATWGTANASASANGARIPSMGELNEIHAAYGARWPMGNHHYWSTDPSNYWWPWQARKTKYLVWGGEGSGKLTGHYSNVVAIR